MLTERQESNLTSAGDCFEHWHSLDRVISDDAYREMIHNETSISLGAGTHSIPGDIDFVLVNTSSGNAIINIPAATSMIALTIIKTSALNTVTVQTSVGNINGASTYVMSAAYSSAKLKAISGNYYKVA